MKSNLIYEFVKEYSYFKLWNVFVNRPVNGNMRKVYLYQTTTHKAEDNINYKKYNNILNKKRKEELKSEKYC